MKVLFSRLSIRELILMLGLSIVCVISLVWAQTTNESIVPQATMSQQFLADPVINASCLDGFAAWDKSNTYKSDSIWSTQLFIPTQSNISAVPIQQFLDLNGDGLVDYLYHKSQSNRGVGENINETETCILLNNGSGWEIGYRCISRFESPSQYIYVPTYYGDCADVANSTL